MQLKQFERDTFEIENKIKQGLEYENENKIRFTYKYSIIL